VRGEAVPPARGIQATSEEFRPRHNYHDMNEPVIHQPRAKRLPRWNTIEELRSRLDTFNQDNNGLAKTKVAP
jgi:hypothetical protein